MMGALVVKRLTISLLFISGFNDIKVVFPKNDTG